MKIMIINYILILIFLLADQEKIKREPQLFLPVRPDTLFAPYDIHKQGLQTNRCSVSYYNYSNPY
jgi:hypothetical protein